MGYQIPQKDVKNLRPRKENKGVVKKLTSKDLTLFNFLHQPPTNKPYNKNN